MQTFISIGLLKGSMFVITAHPLGPIDVSVSFHPNFIIFTA